MSWWSVAALCVGTYALKALGLILGQRLGSQTAESWSLDVIVVPVLAALIVVETFSTGQSLVLDARAPALLVAAVLVWRRAPLVVVALAAAGAAAMIQLIS